MRSLQSGTVPHDELTLQALPQAPRNGRARTTRPATGDGIESVRLTVDRVSMLPTQCAIFAVSRRLSQRQLAGRMQVPRTYISKIENGKAMPTLSSLERLARALEIDICDLLRDARSRQHEEATAILADPFLREIAPYVCRMDAYQRSIFLNQVRDMAMGRRRLA